MTGHGRLVQWWQLWPRARIGVVLRHGDRFTATVKAIRREGRLRLRRELVGGGHAIEDYPVAAIRHIVLL